MIAVGAVVLQVSVMDRQDRLDGLRREINELRAEQKVLREQESRAASPEEIRRVAVDELGMVPVGSDTMITPDMPTLGAAPGPPPESENDSAAPEPYPDEMVP